MSRPRMILLIAGVIIWLRKKTFRLASYYNTGQVQLVIFWVSLTDCVVCKRLSTLLKYRFSFMQPKISQVKMRRRECTITTCKIRTTMPVRKHSCDRAHGAAQYLFWWQLNLINGVISDCENIITESLKKNGARQSLTNSSTFRSDLHLMLATRCAIARSESKLLARRYLNSSRVGCNVWDDKTPSSVLFPAAHFWTVDKALRWSAFKRRK